MAKKFFEYGPNDPVVSSVAAIGQAAPTVDSNGVADLSTLFTSANTSLMSTINGVVGTPNATLESALSGGNA